MAYTITKTANGLKVVDTDGKVSYLSQPVLASSPGLPYPLNAPGITLTSHGIAIAMKLTDIGTIAGSAASATLDTCFDQIATLL